MAIFDILKKELFIERNMYTEEDDIDIASNEENNDEELSGNNDDMDISSSDDKVQGDPEELVKSMLKYAPDQKEQIGVILKYAANSNPDYNIWDSALDYYESEADNISDEGIGNDEIENTEEEPSDTKTEIDNDEVENGDKEQHTNIEVEKDIKIPKM